MTGIPVESHEVATPVLVRTRPLYWSVRRELWENKSIYIAPLVVEALFLFGFFLSTFTLPRRMNAVLALEPVKQHEAVTMPYSAAAFLMIVTAFLVGVFYCLDALHGERRDRSILFWKSLPVSDRTTVLAKAGIPLVVLPLYVFVVAVTAQWLMLLVSTMRLMGNGRALSMLWANVSFVQSAFAFLYGLIVVALWHAPIYAWLLLISAWAKRAAILWAILPVLAIGAVERALFNSTNVMKFLGHRIGGFYERGFVMPPKGSKVVLEPLQHLTPGKFLSTPGLWIGLVLAAIFLAAAVRLRRNREPI